ncbi:MAG: nucleotidyltransferase family protein [Acidobacteria bacterium]|nr:nucleotidyltransferase family protein [Acidobacteriota bacterium]
MIRFSAPALHASPELLWVLRRAFGPAGESPAPAPAIAEAVGALATALDLAPRLAARGTAGLPFARARRRALAQSLRLTELAHDVASVARGLGTPVAFLKFGALELSGRLLPGSRNAGDLDVLVPVHQAEPLAEALAARGFSRSPIPGWKHQLPALHSPTGATLEIHLCVPGVFADASFEDLSALGALEALESIPGGFVPNPSTLVAHALAHALEQHGHHPAAHAAMRLLGDLADIGFHGAEGERLAGEVEALAGSSVSPGEVRAALDLTTALVAGELPDSRSAQALLSHLVASHVSPEYARALKSRAKLTLAGLSRALFPSRAEIDVLYPKLRFPGGAVLARALRPFDLATRLAGSLRAGERLRRSEMQLNGLSSASRAHG